MTIYYQDDLVTLYHGDCRDVLAGMADKSVDAVITDPPYADRTHASSRANKYNNPTPDVSSGIRLGISEFAAASGDELRQAFSEMGRTTRSWVVSNLDYRHAFEFDANPPAGLKCQRIGVWVKAHPMPQITGDRPAQGWEAIAYMHRSDSRSKWNGGGYHGNYFLDPDRRQGHPTAKPLSMVQDIVRKFTNPGDLILDPFAGSGTTLRAAVNEGRRAIGVERDERYCELIASRLAQGAFNFGAVA